MGQKMADMIFNPAKLRALREAAGLSRAELDERAGVPRTYVGAWERGVRWPKAHHLAALAAALGCKVDDLCGGARRRSILRGRGGVAAANAKVALDLALFGQGVKRRRT